MSLRSEGPDVDGPVGSRVVLVDSRRSHHTDHALGAARRYSIRMPLMARATRSCWICSVPSKMS